MLRKISSCIKGTLLENANKILRNSGNHVRLKTASNHNVIDYLNVTHPNGNKMIVKEDQDKAEIFAEHFSSVFTKVSNASFKMPVPLNTSIPMADLIISERMIYNQLKNLDVSKSCGPDSIHPRVLKELASELRKPVAFIFNLSLRIGYIPLDCKHSIGCAVPKKGSRLLVENYRPISLTSILCKVLERLVRNHIFDHFCNNDLLNNKQFGFVAGRSLALQLLNILDDWTKNLDDGGHIDIVYTDFEKAFD